jgi:hypothetical protein
MSSGNRRHDDATFASHPGRLALSHDKLRRLRPDLYGVRGLFKSVVASLRGGRQLRQFVEEQLQLGDSRAAVVMSTAPLLIAAYTDEIDCVAMLRFPDELAGEYRLSPGGRLLTVNYYGDAPNYDGDLIPGRGAEHRWTGIHPLIADFLTDDHARLEACKQQLPAEEWQRAAALGAQYLTLRSGVARDGRPGYASFPALVLSGM